MREVNESYKPEDSRPDKPVLMEQPPSNFKKGRTISGKQRLIGSVQRQYEEKMTIIGPAETSLPPR